MKKNLLNFEEIFLSPKIHFPIKNPIHVFQLNRIFVTSKLISVWTL